VFTYNIVQCKNQTVAIGSGISLQNPSNTFGSGTYAVSLTTTTAAGCQSMLMMNNFITVLPNPNAAFTANPPVTTEDNPTIQFLDQSTDASSFSWEFGNGAGSTSTTQNPVFTYDFEGTYTVVLWVENTGGCIDSASMTVLIKPSYTIYIPNSFSPNHDVHNEIFSPSGTGWNIDFYSMRIYSRWGDLVYSTTDVNYGWNGNMPDGSEAPQGVYTVKIFLRGPDGNDRVYFGSVTLLR